jgi:hypothetical protein
MTSETWHSRLAPIVTWAAVLALILDVTLWRWLTMLSRWLSHFAIFTRLERLVDRLSPNWVVTIFVAPFIPLIPIMKLGEFWLIAHHHDVWAALMILGTKVLGAAFATRLFAIARPKMLQLRWFAWAYGWVAWLLDLGHRTLEAMPAWRATREALRQAMQATRAALRRLWR